MEVQGLDSYEDDDEIEQFTDQARNRLRQAAEAFAAVVLQHAERLCEMQGSQREFSEIFALNDTLSTVAQRFSKAQFDLTGTFLSFDMDEDTGDEETQESSETEHSGRIAMLTRHDFVITDQEELIAAGRAAYLQTRPNDDDDDAAFDVQTVDRAIYQLMHASGWDQILSNIPGLRPDGNVQTTLDAHEPLDFNDPFAIYYTQGE